MTYRSFVLLDRHRLAIVIGACALGIGCGDNEAPLLSRDELMRPEACQDCHPVHYQEWSGSMHAYAADDPVFLAMNRRGQEATSGQLGDFCVNCHAPMAVRLGLTRDGSNLSEVPQWAKGVTCFFCHSVDAVEGTHNNPLHLADDGVLRGGIADPAAGAGHRSLYSALIDADSQESSKMCGSCHDIVTQAGIHLERTFSEWTETIFAQSDARRHLSCAQCHMFTTPGVVADVSGVPLRVRREHTFAGVDVALTPWPEGPAQRRAIDRDMAGVLLPRLCVTPVDGGQIELTLDNIGAGHDWPSGATHDRRAWVEVIAYDDKNGIVFDSGNVPGDKDPEDMLEKDPQLWRIYDDVFDEQDRPVKFFWEVRKIKSQLLTPQVTTDPSDPRFYHAVTRVFPVPGKLPNITRVTARVLIRPLALALIDELAASSHLDPAVRAAVPTIELTGTRLTWTAGGASCVVP